MQNVIFYKNVIFIISLTASTSNSIWGNAACKILLIPNPIIVIESVWVNIAALFVVAYEFHSINRIYFKSGLPPLDVLYASGLGNLWKYRSLHTISGYFIKHNVSLIHFTRKIRIRSSERHQSIGSRVWEKNRNNALIRGIELENLIFTSFGSIDWEIPMYSLSSNRSIFLKIIFNDWRFTWTLKNHYISK